MDSKSFLIGVAATFIVGGAGYYLGTQQQSTAVESPATTGVKAQVPAPAPAAPVAEPAALPAGHPTPTTQAASVQPTLSFNHFRVGSKNVKSILADGDVIWIGTSGGVIRYDASNDSHKLYDTRSGLLANGIFYLGKLNGQLVAGTYGGGFGILDEASGTWKIYNVPEGLADAFVYDMLEMDNGDLWVATWSGANLIRGGALDDPDKWETYTVENTDGGLPNDWVYGLRKGLNGEVWMATEGGLARYADGEWSNWNHKDGLGAEYEMVRDQIQFKNDPSKVSAHHAKQKVEMGLENVSVAYNPNYIVSIMVDQRDGSVWTGTWGGGLAHYKDGQFTNYTMSDGLPSNHVSSLLQDENDIMWVGSSHGLSRFDGNDFNVFTREDGLFSNSVFSMAFAEDGSAWLGSYGGVARIFDLPR